MALMPLAGVLNCIILNFFKYLHNYQLKTIRDMTGRLYMDAT